MSDTTRTSLELLSTPAVTALTAVALPLTIALGVMPDIRATAH